MKTLSGYDRNLWCVCVYLRRQKKKKIWKYFYKAIPDICGWFFPGTFYVPPTYINAVSKHHFAYFLLSVHHIVRTHALSIKLSVVVSTIRCWWWCTPLVYFTTERYWLCVRFYIFSTELYNNSLIIHISAPKKKQKNIIK